MKRIALCALACCLAAVSAAGTRSQSHVDAIWDAANDRMSQQIEIWFSDGDFPALISVLAFQFTLDPSNYDVATSLGWMQENIQQWDKALATYVAYRNENPKDPDRALPLADFYSREKAYAKIPPILEPVLARKPAPHPNNFRILAHAYERLHLYGDAKRVYQAYIAVAPTNDPGLGAAKKNLAQVEKLLDKGS